MSAYPISIEWPPSADEATSPPTSACRRVLGALGLAGRRALGVGVDRFDYTKGIQERLLAVERTARAAPGMIGKFTFVQVAAPSRSSLGLPDRPGRIEAACRRINERFGRSGLPAGASSCASTTSPPTCSSLPRRRPAS